MNKYKHTLGDNLHTASGGGVWSIPLPEGPHCRGQGNDSGRELLE